MPQNRNEWAEKAYRCKAGSESGVVTARTKRDAVRLFAEGLGCEAIYKVTRKLTSTILTSDADHEPVVQTIFAVSYWCEALTAPDTLTVTVEPMPSLVLTGTPGTEQIGL